MSADVENKAKAETVTKAGMRMYCSLVSPANLGGGGRRKFEVKTSHIAAKIKAKAIIKASVRMYCASVS